MSLTSKQQIYLARRLAKAHGLFVVVKTHRVGTDGSTRTDYILYRELSHARPTAVGKRQSAAALLALVEKVTDCPASWIGTTNKTATQPLTNPNQQESSHGL